MGPTIWILSVQLVAPLLGHSVSHQEFGLTHATPIEARVVYSKPLRPNPVYMVYLSNR